MSNQFQFELSSPDRLVANRAAVMVSVPGSEGMYSVLAGHAPMITMLDIGVIELYDQDDKTISGKFFVAGGFAEVTGTRCTVLADEAVPLDKIDRAKIEKDIDELNKEIANAATDEDRVKFEAKMNIAKGKLQAIEA